MIGSILDAFTKFGMFMGICLAVWTLWFCSDKSAEIQQYGATHPHYYSGEVGRGVLANMHSTVTWHESLLSYGSWYKSLSGLEKIGWIVLGCPVVGIFVAGVILYLILKIFWESFKKLLHLG